ncbi:MAG TPA: hypothetical protein VFK90_14665 [Anaeromyxobacter sp.]|nr:hypothetical protein [Anaeromyxobacter sp.]
MQTSKLDQVLVPWFRRIDVPLMRAAILVVYAWFGVLKLFDASPANPLVRELLERTLPFITFERFIVFLGLFEIAIGIAFAVPKLEKLALAMVVPHLVMTSGPLVFLPSVSWKGFLLPTLEGQYCIKNVLIAAVAVGILAHLQPSSTEEVAPQGSPVPRSA